MQKRLCIVLMALTTAVSHAQTCNFVNMARSAPDNRYILLNNDSEVKDSYTSLIWQRCSLGQMWNGSICTGTANSYNWVNALQTAKNIGDGWRLPNVKELDSLVEQACYSPAINNSVFPNTVNSAYWSSTPSAFVSNNSWSVNFISGGRSNSVKSNNLTVRLVRSN